MVDSERVKKNGLMGFVFGTVLGAIGVSGLLYETANPVALNLTEIQETTRTDERNNRALYFGGLAATGILLVCGSVTYVSRRREDQDN